MKTTKNIYCLHQKYFLLKTNSKWHYGQIRPFFQPSMAGSSARAISTTTATLAPIFGFSSWSAWVRIGSGKKLFYTLNCKSESQLDCNKLLINNPIKYVFCYMKIVCPAVCTTCVLFVHHFPSRCDPPFENFKQCKMPFGVCVTVLSTILTCYWMRVNCSGWNWNSGLNCEPIRFDWCLVTTWVLFFLPKEKTHSFMIQ